MANHAGIVQLHSGCLQLAGNLRNGHLGEPVSAVEFAPDGKTLATGSDSARVKHVRLFDAATGKEFTKIGFKAAAIKFLPDGKHLALGVHKEVILWDLKRNKTSARLTGFQQTVNALDISADGKFLVASDADSAIVFDLAMNKAILAESQPGKTLNAVALSQDGTLLALGYGHFETLTDPGELAIWDIRKATLLNRLAQPAGEIQAAAFLPGNTDVVTGGVSNQPNGPPRGGTFIWNAKTGARLRLMPEHRSEVQAIAISAKAELLASSGAGEGRSDTIHSWNVLV